jgi:phosphate transport system protein
MGDFAAHLSEFTLHSYPEKSYSADYKSEIEALAENANQICKTLEELFDTSDIKLLDKIVQIDNKTNDIYAKINDAVRSDKYSDTAKSAVDLALIVRFYERFGDHGIAVARQFLYIVTGQYSLKEVDSGE